MGLVRAGFPSLFDHEPDHLLRPKCFLEHSLGATDRVQSQGKAPLAGTGRQGPSVVSGYLPPGAHPWPGLRLTRHLNCLQVTTRFLRKADQLGALSSQPSPLQNAPFLASVTTAIFPDLGTPGCWGTHGQTWDWGGFPALRLSRWGRGRQEKGIGLVGEVDLILMTGDGDFRRGDCCEKESTPHPALPRGLML